MEDRDFDNIRHMQAFRDLIEAWQSVLLCLVVIFGFSAQTGTASNQLSGELTHEIAANTIVVNRTTGRNMIELNFIVRKMAHFALYLSRGWLSAFSDELHQSFVPGRDARWWDVTIDLWRRPA